MTAASGAREFRRFEGNVRRTLENHLEDGGGLLLFTPFVGRVGLAGRLETMGIEIREGWIVNDTTDPQGRRGPTAYLRVREFDRTHAVTRNFSEENSFEFEFFHALEVRESTPAVSLLRTDRGSWLELDMRDALRRDSEDALGPFTVVAASEGRRDGARGRVVVFGSALPALDQQFSMLHDSRQLILNAVYWMTGRQELAAGVGGDVDTERVSLIEEENGPFLRALFWVAVVVTPLLALAAGIIVALARRR